MKEVHHPLTHFRFLAALAIVATSSLIADDTFVDPRTPGEYPDNPFYGVVSSGYAWTLSPGIDNPNPSQWDASLQGYNSSLGGSPFLTLGFGREFLNLLYIDLDYTYYQTFHYQKYQTNSNSNPPARTRFFDLDHQNVLFNVSLAPWTFQLGCLGFAPYAGAGIGVGLNRITNFHTVIYAPTAGVGSTSSIGITGTRAVFAWQAVAGIKLIPILQHLSFDLGYRYYDGGSFTGPGDVMDTEAAYQGAMFLNATPWTGHLKANEFYLALILGF